MRKIWGLGLVIFLAAAPVHAGKALKEIQALPTEVVAANHVVAVMVEVGDVAKPTATLLDQKAAEKRLAAKLQPIDAQTERPAPTSYATLPMNRMFPLVIDDETRDWGLVSGRPIKLLIGIDTIKMADAGMAILVGSADELAGLVTVTDAQSGEKLGEFYVDVLNFRAGLLGLAMRGDGVREKLAEEFAKRISQELTGKKSKPASAAKKA